jgi:hypothetical protein
VCNGKVIVEWVEENGVLLNPWTMERRKEGRFGGVGRRRKWRSYFEFFIGLPKGLNSLSFFFPDFLDFDFDFFVLQVHFTFLSVLVGKGRLFVGRRERIARSYNGRRGSIIGQKTSKRSPNLWSNDVVILEKSSSWIRMHAPLGARVEMIAGRKARTGFQFFLKLEKRRAIKY